MPSDTPKLLTDVTEASAGGALADVHAPEAACDAVGPSHGRLAEPRHKERDAPSCDVPHSARTSAPPVGPNPSREDRKNDLPGDTAERSGRRRKRRASDAQLEAARLAILALDQAQYRRHLAFANYLSKPPDLDPNELVHMAVDFALAGYRAWREGEFDRFVRGAMKSIASHAWESHYNKLATKKQLALHGALPTNESECSARDELIRLLRSLEEQGDTEAISMIHEMQLGHSATAAVKNLGLRSKPVIILLRIRRAYQGLER